MGTRPSGGRPPGRRGGGGIGPGPGYRPGPPRGGKPKGGMGGKSSFATIPQQAFAAALFLALPLGVVGGVGAYLLHGYGVI